MNNEKLRTRIALVGCFRWFLCNLHPIVLKKNFFSAEATKSQWQAKRTHTYKLLLQRWRQKCATKKKKKDQELQLNLFICITFFGVNDLQAIVAYICLMLSLSRSLKLLRRTLLRQLLSWLSNFRKIYDDAVLFTTVQRLPLHHVDHQIRICVIWFFGFRVSDGFNVFFSALLFRKM